MAGKSKYTKPERRVDNSKRELVERLKAEATLNEPWEQLMAIFDAIDEKVYVADPETHKILYANPAKKQVFGKDILGQRCYRVFQGLHEPCDFCTNPMIFGENLGKTHIWEFRNRKTETWLRCIDRAIRWPDGRMVRFEMAIDIHDRKVAEEALRESQARYLLLIETMNEGFSINDENGIVTYANKKMCDILGYEIDEMVGHPVKELMNEEGGKVWAREFEKRKKRESSPYEMKLIRKDGETLPVIVSPRPLFDDKGVFRGSFAAITDISHLKRTEESLKERETELVDKTAKLEEMNAALRVLLEKREMDKDDLEGKVLLNIRQLIGPYIEKLKKIADDHEQKAYLGIIEANLQSITSSFSRDLLFRYQNLTPMEIQVANLVRDGRTSKEIAELMNLSTRTIESHRKNIRRKMGLKDKGLNFRTTLMSIQ